MKNKNYIFFYLGMFFILIVILIVLSNLIFLEYCWSFPEVDLWNNREERTNIYGYKNLCEFPDGGLCIVTALGRKLDIIIISFLLGHIFLGIFDIDKNLK